MLQWRRHVAAFAEPQLFHHLWVVVPTPLPNQFQAVLNARMRQEMAALQQCLWMLAGVRHQCHELALQVK